jgi:hypothetical protein
LQANARQDESAGLADTERTYCFTGIYFSAGSMAVCTHPPIEREKATNVF